MLRSENGKCTSGENKKTKKRRKNSISPNRNIFRVLACRYFSYYILYTEAYSLVVRLIRVFHHLGLISSVRSFFLFLVNVCLYISIAQLSLGVYIYSVLVVCLSLQFLCIWCWLGALTRWHQKKTRRTLFHHLFILTSFGLSFQIFLRF
jgi:hypothetical protein